MLFGSIKWKELFIESHSDKLFLSQAKEKHIRQAFNFTVLTLCPVITREAPHTDHADRSDAQTTMKCKVLLPCDTDKIRITTKDLQNARIK
jgi:hypothetical protein